MGGAGGESLGPFVEACRLDVTCPAVRGPPCFPASRPAPLPLPWEDAKMAASNYYGFAPGAVAGPQYRYYGTEEGGG